MILLLCNEGPLFALGMICLTVLLTVTVYSVFKYLGGQR